MTPFNRLIAEAPEATLLRAFFEATVHHSEQTRATIDMHGASPKTWPKEEVKSAERRMQMINRLAVAISERFPRDSIAALRLYFDEVNH